MLARTRINCTSVGIYLKKFSQNVGSSSGSGTSSAPPPPPAAVNTDVPGLSAAVIHPASGPIGPGVDPNKSGAYKVPEYFCYDNMSYFEAEIEMAKYRLPQPSAIKK